LDFIIHHKRLIDEYNIIRKRKEHIESLFKLRSKSTMSRYPDKRPFYEFNYQDDGGPEREKFKELEDFIVSDFPKEKEKAI